MSKKKYETEEEAYEAHKNRVKQWQKDNPEKFNAYRKKYEQSGKRKTAQAERYAAMDPVQKEDLLAKQRVRSAATREAQKEKYHSDSDYRDLCLQRAKDRYQKNKEK